MSPMFRSLAVRNYRIYATGSLISNVGTWMQTTAMAWLVLVLTGSGFFVGLTMALQLLPTLLLSPIAGATADRIDKRRLLIAMQIGMAVPSAVLGVLAVAGWVQIWHVLVLTFGFGIARAFEAPARQSFVPEMVEAAELSNAVSLNSASFNTGRLLGPAIAGVLIAAFGGGAYGAGLVIIINALSFGGAIAALCLMDTAALHAPPSPGVRRGAVRAGLRYVRSRPDLILLFTIVFFLGAFGMNFQITSSLMATEEFGLGSQGFGVFGTVLAVGSLAGSLLAARRVRPRLRFIVIAALSFAVVQVLSGLMPHQIAYAAILPLVGLSIMTVATSANAMIQLTSTPVMRGRVAALYLMVFIGSVPLGSPFVGFVAETFGVRSALYATGAIVALGVGAATAWYLRSMQLRVGVTSLRHPRMYVTPLTLEEGRRAAEAA